MLLEMMNRLLRYRGRHSATLAVVLTALAVLYVAWKITQSPDQAMQFAFNGLAVGAVYALLAMGFTLVYSTVWFFDLYYGAAAALGAYGVFYLRSHDTLAGRYEVNEPILNALFAVVTAGVVAWSFHTGFGSTVEEAAKAAGPQPWKTSSGASACWWARRPGCTWGSH